jgi:hypothetical protein
MRAPSRIRRIVSAAAIAAVAAMPAVAPAGQVNVPALNGGFTGGTGGWTSTASCAPLCSVTNGFDPTTGASSPGSASVVYTALSGLLGGLASGTSTWFSPTFTWTSARPASASLSLARKAAIGSLLAVGGSASVRVQLRDLSSGTTSTIASDGITSAEAAFAGHTLTIDPSLLEQGHSYRILLTTNMAAAALLSGIRVSYDDVILTGDVEDAATGTTGSGGNGGSTGSNPGTTASTGPPAIAPLRLSAPREVHFRPGRPLTVRVRVTRAAKPVPRLGVMLRIGTTTRRLTTGRDGYASATLTRRARTPLRIAFSAGGAVVTTWARVRA